MSIIPPATRPITPPGTVRRPADDVSGLHVIADLHGCPDSPWMTDSDRLRDRCVRYIREVGLFDVGTLFHIFPGGGVTGTVILAESHLCIHTWPEHAFVSLDVFVCNYGADNTDKARQLAQRLVALFTPTAPRIQEVFR